jgi:TRAP-type C4-dicarboxylate transport system permease large subunit
VASIAASSVTVKTLVTAARVMVEAGRVSVLSRVMVVAGIANVLVEVRVKVRRATVVVRIAVRVLVLVWVMVEDEMMVVL